MNWWEKFWSIIEEALQGDYAPPTPPVVPVVVPLPVTPTPMPVIDHPTRAEQLYALSKSLLDTHLSLNDAVPIGVGCMEAMSKVLVEFGIAGIPAKGIEGTYDGLLFFEQSKQFKEIFTYTPGAVGIAATGTGNGKIPGHTFVCGYNSLMSNNSETGLWDTQWDIDRFIAYYTGYGGMTVRYFLPV